MMDAGFHREEEHRDPGVGERLSHDTRASLGEALAPDENSQLRAGPFGEGA